MLMNGPGDIPLNDNSSTPDTQVCSIISVIPALGMSSCRGRAEAFARSLSSKLRTLGTQNDDGVISQEEESIIPENNTSSTWQTTNDSENPVTDLQPLRHESDSFFDFDCELESPGSPVDECEYLQLIETASNTPHNSAAESGYICASTSSSRGSADVPYFEHIHHDDATDGSGCVPSTLHNGHDENEEKHCEDPDDTSPATSKNMEDFENTSNATTKFQEALVETEQADETLTPVDLVTLQDEIINELQEHSARIGNIIESMQVQANTEINKTPEVAYSSPSNNKTENDETITHENFDNIDQLHIKTTETTTTELKPAQNEVQIGLDTNEESARTSIQELSETNHNESKTQGEKSTFDGHDDEEDDCRPQRVRRCSSLKTGKTPPGTPGRKKIVRFADVLGLDLADIKTFLDEIPTIPKSAFEDLEVLESEPPLQLGPKSDKLLMPLFQQPGGLPKFLDRVREKQVSLENAAVTDHVNQTITGTVRVRNLDFNKSVYIRYTLDNWRSYADLQANYAENSCDGFSDKFTFFLFGNSLQIGQRIEFAVRFHCKGQQFWDNNYGTNYCFQCLPASTPINTHTHTIHVQPPRSHSGELFSPTLGDSWCSSFY
ncbi:glycogen-binding subunit 76A [Anastrepha ludens]|uniref:glycogen-binding subunit 76A n=1 Tax=Anastrepha ludens TaxID=28586 RepID=UPI0023AFD844|nr:glycogen-binding subunit 76A [Anastrepha ludens]XP_053957215.1 glycogen-binding subunit 76A [Anastrepha ludens]XP_053957216.1 glycogen-binding subunit 76A [Anastrepha ludens]XP_053957219.1 glycogen-binding subunit 76A [Anastrepha ludens]XP_053957220.1 glycogen-binding subunit 76A [Anastrepha ludens]XP_053957221.1 glycogen-binding subunit 76A [Anastrepha ludens]XP_053957222.1 glycogen-binding subunit 76A [Anastrepha ludens]XP_053957223.1 glycogen-binding subunit 76A [Anastrepha ludens]XP_